MLKFLSIENFALVEHLRIELGAGLNLITGETGSGKSILVGAVGLLMGKRASQDMIRQGFEAARVEGLFELERDHAALPLLAEAGIGAENGELVVRREISVSGANKVYVNDRLVTLSFLAELGLRLIDIHGQHDQQQLLDPSNHLEFLDVFGANRLLRDSVAAAFHEMDRVKRRMEDIRGDERERLQRIDLLDFQISEIDKLGLRPGLDRELEGERELLASAEKRLSVARESFQTLYEREGAVLEQLSRVDKDLTDLSEFDAGMQPVRKQLEEARYQIEETAFQLRDYRDGIEFNPARLEQIEEQISEIRHVCRKYGGSVDEVLQYLKAIQDEMEQLRGADRSLDRLEAELAVLKERFESRARQLSEKRGSDARGLSRSVESELSELAMENTVLQIAIEPSEPSAKGVDSVEFLISPNPGEEPRPLVKTASGGELSRIILALKSIRTLENYSKTLIFDEVDAGIGGRAASSVGEKLARLSSDHQVLCVTHLPQIAAHAALHFTAAKSQEGGRTVVRVLPLDAQGRVDELSRMMAGEQVSDAVTRHAKELLKQ